MRINLYKMPKKASAFFSERNLYTPVLDKIFGDVIFTHSIDPNELLQQICRRSNGKWYYSSLNKVCLFVQDGERLYDILSRYDEEVEKFEVKTKQDEEKSRINRTNRELLNIFAEAIKIGKSREDILTMFDEYLVKITHEE